LTQVGWTSVPVAPVSNLAAASQMLAPPAERYPVVATTK